MLCGQASATIAWLGLRDGLQPREIAADPQRVREVQRTLVRGNGGPGILLWPYHDLPPEHAAFEAINLLSVAGLWKPDPESVFFQPDRELGGDEWSALLARLPDSAREKLKTPAAPKTRAEAARRAWSALGQ